MTEVAIRETLPEAPSWLNYGPNLDDLMWVVQMEYDMRGMLTVWGIIKPNLAAARPSELRTDFAAKFNHIILRLEEAGANFYDHPELAITGYANHQCHLSPDHPNRFGGMEAKVTIKLIG